MTELTHDPAADGRAVFETVMGGGTAIFPTDVGYAIVGHSEPALKRIYEAKQRSFSKPCGCFSSVAMFDEVIRADAIHPRARDFVAAVIEDNDLPLSIVAPFRPDHPIFATAAPFVLANATKAGTVDLLMNAGPTHDTIAALALESGRGVFGSSANRSLSGSKYLFGDIEPEVSGAVDLPLDRGATKYSHPKGLGSTIIDLQSFRPFRIGIRFDEIRAIAQKDLGIEIEPVVIGAS
jgi:tRNA A37 threonylcarbamoyladenosine synthetase subunit TsaC/SUA5/YrdC